MGFRAMVVLVGLSLAAAAHKEDLNPRNPATMGAGGLLAVVVLVPNNGTDIAGTILFTQLPDQLVHIEGNITGLAAGKHGFHVHQYGDMTEGCASMMSHFNPGNNHHGGPNAEDRHTGDLGNIEADGNGVAKIVMTDAGRQISLYPGVTSIIGRGLVVHEKVDDLGQGGNAESLKTGNAGGRLACGVVAYRKGSK